jgi:hypothetical protein
MSITVWIVATGNVLSRIVACNVALTVGMEGVIRLRVKFQLR